MPCHESNFVDPRTTLESKFNDIKVLGSSCTGCVLSAVEKSGKQQRYALKRLSLKRRSHCRVALRELRILKRLRHENVVKTSSIRAPNGSDISELDAETFQKLDYVYLAEELMDTDMYNILNKVGKIEEKIAKLFLYQLLRAVKYIHSANVIHRDIKPGNLFVNANDLSMKVGDFGLARIVDPKFDHAGQLTELVATRYYRSPEVILAPGNYDSAVDIWSTGCVFAEMCTGSVLFPGENDLQQIDCIQSWFNRGKFLTQKLSGISQAGLDILQKMLRLDPSKRQTASQLLEDPYFGDISDIIDEPACPQPDVFRIEHEVDDLPVQTLKSMLLTECCPDKFSTQAMNRELFNGFDEDFHFDDESTKVAPERKDSYSFSSTDNSCPSLLNILSSSFVDEPCRDPACSEARSLEDSFRCDSLQSECTTSGHCSPNFPKVTSLLDTGRNVVSPVADSRRPVESRLPGRNFQAIPRSFLCSTELENQLINIIKEQTAVSSHRNCRMSQFTGSECLKTDKLNRNFSHWDAIRIWI